MHGITGMSTGDIGAIFVEEMASARGYIERSDGLPRFLAATARLARMRSATRWRDLFALDSALDGFGWSQEQRAMLVAAIYERYALEVDRSRYSLMNAVTSLARDTTDPEQRWRLETLGGDIAFAGAPVPPVKPGPIESAVPITLQTA